MARIVKRSLLFSNKNVRNGKSFKRNKKVFILKMNRMSIFLIFMLLSNFSSSFAMELDAKIYIAGHHWLIGSALLHELEKDGYRNVITRSLKELDLRNQEEVESFFSIEKPEYAILAAAKVGEIVANR
jgi:hypothetical protein